MFIQVFFFVEMVVFIRIYFAAPLFSEMEKDYNLKIAKQLRSINGIEVFLPQEQESINNKNNYADSKTIAKYDTMELLKSKLMIAVVDGVAMDAGVAAEIGIAYQAHIPIIGLFTDVRQHGYKNQSKIEALSKIGESQFFYVNLYPVGLIKLNGIMVNNTADLLYEVKKYLGKGEF